MSISTIHSTTASFATARAQSTVHSTTANDGSIGAEASSVWTLTPSVGIQTVLNLSATNALAFGQSVVAQNVKAASSVWTLTPSVDVEAVFSRGSTQQLDFSQLAEHNVIFLSATNALAFSQDAVTGPNTFNRATSQQLDLFQAVANNVQFLSATNAITFGQAPSFFLALGISITQQLDFFQAADSHVRFLSASNALSFGHDVAIGPNTLSLGLSHPWIIESDGHTTILLSATSALTFGQGGNRAGVGENQLDFDHSLSFIQSKQTSNQWVFDHLAEAVYGAQHLFASNAWVF